LKAPEKDRLTVLLAPSWGPSAILSVYGARIIDALINTGYEVIIRPHPQSKVSEADMLSELMEAYPDGVDVSWNFDNDNFDVLNRADVMITDFSGVIFDYALVFDKPIIYTEGQFDNSVYDAAWLDKPLWKFSVYPTLGIPLDESQFPKMREVIDGVLVDDRLKAGRDASRADAWAYRGESAVRTVDYLVHKHQELTNTDR
jgi:CDP-glycerol glycerophosphotransferase (TagB/SpsB family)